MIKDFFKYFSAGRAALSAVGMAVFIFATVDQAFRPIVSLMRDDISLVLSVFTDPPLNDRIGLVRLENYHVNLATNKVESSPTTESFLLFAGNGATEASVRLKFTSCDSKPSLADGAISFGVVKEGLGDLVPGDFYGAPGGDSDRPVEFALFSYNIIATEGIEPETTGEPGKNGAPVKNCELGLAGKTDSTIGRFISYTKNEVGSLVVGILILLAMGFPIGFLIAKAPDLVFRNGWVACVFGRLDSHHTNDVCGGGVRPHRFRECRIPEKSNTVYPLCRWVVGVADGLERRA